MPESDVASAPPERSSVYDFLYHDPHRIASFLAQFTQHGHLESLSRSESTAAATTNKSVVTGRAGVPTLGSVGRSGERAASGSVTEALTTTYDPLWANALALLDHLSQHGLIRRDVTRASIGQFVLAQGELDILNLGTLRAAWAENPITPLLTAQLRLGDRGEEQVFQGVVSGPHRDSRGLAPCASAQTRRWGAAARTCRGFESKDGGSPPGSRGGSTRSTPLAGPKCERMMLVRFRELGLRPTTSPRIRRASSSMERPLSAARTRRRVLTSSSRLRIVMVAIRPRPPVVRGG